MKKQFLIALAALCLTAPLAAQSGSIQSNPTRTPIQTPSLNPGRPGTVERDKPGDTIKHTEREDVDQAQSSSGFLRREPRQIFRASDLDKDEDQDETAVQTIHRLDAAHNLDWFDKDLNANGHLDEDEWAALTSDWNESTRDQWSSFDLDEDGILSESEKETARATWNNWAAEQVTVFDADGDGRLTGDELSRVREATAQDMDD